MYFIYDLFSTLALSDFNLFSCDCVISPVIRFTGVSLSYFFTASCRKFLHSAQLTLRICFILFHNFITWITYNHFCLVVTIFTKHHSFITTLTKIIFIDTQMFMDFSNTYCTSLKTTLFLHSGII